MKTAVRTAVPLVVAPRDIADCLAMSVDFVYAEIKADNLQAIRVGRELRVAKDEAVRYLQALQAPVPDAWVGR